MNVPTCPLLSKILAQAPRSNVMVITANFRVSEVLGVYLYFDSFTFCYDVKDYEHIDFQPGPTARSDVRSLLQSGNILSSRLVMK